MRNRGPLRRGAPDLLLVIGVMAFMLGLGALATGVIGVRESASRAGHWSPTESGIPAPATPDSPRCEGACERAAVAGDRLGVASPTRRAGTAPSPAVVGADRHYLVRMATMMRRHPATVVPTDPYQMSLNPGLYLPGTATPAS